MSDAPIDPPDNLILLSDRRGPAPDEPVERPDRPPDDDGIVPSELVPPDEAFMAPAIEAVLFCAGEPISTEKIREILCDPEIGDVRAALRHLQASYDSDARGLRLVEVAGGWQIRTHPRFASWVIRARGGRPLRLSQAALETLAIVAYKQPVTRAEIEDVRGVDPGPVLRMLLERGLVRTLGHREEPGRPLIFGTTPRFLETFGLKDLADLPTLRDYAELGETPPPPER